VESPEGEDCTQDRGWGGRWGGEKKWRGKGKEGGIRIGKAILGLPVFFKRRKGDEQGTDLGEKKGV